MVHPEQTVGHNTNQQTTNKSHSAQGLWILTKDPVKLGHKNDFDNGDVAAHDEHNISSRPDEECC